MLKLLIFTSFITSLGMWKISAALLCVIMAMSSALKSNLQLMESKLYLNTNDEKCKFEYFDQRELEAVVIIMFGMPRCYSKISMAYMISPKVGLTVGNYVSNLSGQGLEDYEPIFVAKSLDENIGIVEFISLDKYIEERMGVHSNEHDTTHLAMIVLERSIKFSQSAPPFPLLGTKLNGHKGMTIGMNVLDSCPQGHTFLWKVDVCVRAEEEDRFFVKLCDMNTRFTLIDQGNPVFSGDKFVGILTNSHYGIVIKVLEFKSYIQEIATLKSLGELYLNE